MPYYDYECAQCGPFREKRSMAEASSPQSCPFCAAPSPRAILSAPRISGMSAARRGAFATNERSANEPKFTGGGHGTGCGCCARPSKPAAPGAAKSFPAARPWMISH